MRECPIPDAEADGRNPENCVKYWKAHIATEPHYDPERECLVVLLLDGRRWIKGHSFISHGTADTVVGQPKDIMRAAVTASAAAIVIMHNHPSGNSEPSKNDLALTLRVAKAGEILGIALQDSVILGSGDTFTSTRKVADEKIAKFEKEHLPKLLESILEGVVQDMKEQEAKKSEQPQSTPGAIQLPAPRQSSQTSPDDADEGSFPA